MAQLNFDATQVAPSDDFSAIPSGDYVALIEDSVMKPTKAGTGQYLELKFSIVEGAYANRKLWSRLNLDNPSQVAVDIAQRDLSAICHATGVLNLQDSVALHGKPMKIRVGFDKNNAEQNEIKSYKRIDGMSPRPQQSSADVAVIQPLQQAPVTSNRPPWEQTGA
jgi:hypothetical protein